MPKIVKRSFLGSLRKIQESFGVDFNGVTRTFSFGLKPDKEQEEVLKKWFFEVGQFKKQVYLSIYEDFKTDTKKYFTEGFKYATFFKGRNISRDGFNVIKTQPILEGLRIEIEGTMRSFASNFSGQAFAGNKGIAEKNVKKISEAKEQLGQDSNDINQQILAKFKKLSDLELEPIIKNYKGYLSYKDLVENINNLIAEYNYSANQYVQKDIDKKMIKLPKLNFLKRPTGFPIVEKMRDVSAKQDKKERALKDLSNFAAKKIDKDLVVKWLEKYAKTEERYHRTNKRNDFEFRLVHWACLNKNKKNIDVLVDILDKALNEKITKLKKHISIKQYDSLGFSDYLNVLSLKARLSNKGKAEDINEIKGLLRGIFLSGKGEKETITIPGFSWGKEDGGKPLKNVSLAKTETKDGKIRLALCISSSVSSFNINQKEGDIYFVKQTGGSRQKAYSAPKIIKYIKGKFDKSGEGSPLIIDLHFGKSQGRKYILNNRWGLLSKKPGLFLMNGRLKRIRMHPGDDWTYFFDLGVASDEKVYGFKKYEADIRSRADSVIGIDRGEVVPIAFALINKEGNLVKSGFLGKDSYIAKLKEYNNEIKNRQSKGQRLSKSLRAKISKLQKTTLETAISEIVDIAASNKSFIVMENLPRNMGIEKSLIPKRTYNIVEKLLSNALIFAGLVRASTKGSKKYYGGLDLVVASKTSQTCPDCRIIWPDRYKEIIAYSKSKNFKNIDIENKTAEFNGKNLSLNQEWTKYNPFEKRHIKENLSDLDAVIGKNREKVESLLKSALNCRPSQDVFICHECGYSNNADIVGAINIAKKGLEELTKPQP